MRWYPLVLITLALLLIPPTLSYDLSDYPSPLFIDAHGKFNGVIIIGDFAASEDVIGAISILGSLQRAALEKSITADGRVLNPTPIPNTAIRLASEIDDIAKYNAIIVGGSCANPYASRLMGYPADCLEGFKTGIGYVRLYEHENGKRSLLVAGRSAMDTRRAANVVASYDRYVLNGTEQQVTNYNIDEITIKGDGAAP